MPKRVSVLILIIVVLAIAVGFTSIDSSSIQGDMNGFEDQLTNGGIITTVNNSSALANIALKIQEVINSLVSASMSFFKKIISLFT